MIVAIFVVALLAAGFRIRGDAAFARWTGRGATTARIVAWAIPVAASGWLLGLEWPVAVALGVAAWVGCLAPWWGSLDLGRHEGTWFRDFCLHSARGVLWTLPMAGVVFLAQFSVWPTVGAGLWWPLLAAGALCGPAYELGYRIREKRGTEIGEALFGALIGGALVLAVSP